MTPPGERRRSRLHAQSPAKVAAVPSVEPEQTAPDQPKEPPSAPPPAPAPAPRTRARRITVDADPELHRAIRREALDQGGTVADIIRALAKVATGETALDEHVSDALREVVAREISERHAREDGERRTRH